MAYRIAINGYGRIGRCVLRALVERARSGGTPALEVVAINELGDLDTIAYLTRFDTTHGRFPGEVTARDGELVVDGRPIRVFSEPEASRLPWRELDVDLVLECSGQPGERDSAGAHLDAGARRLLFSHPAGSDIDATIIRGINDDTLAPAHRIVSAASCTTNCVVPILTVLDEALGVEHGVTTTLHSAMNDQPVIDAYHRTNLRLTRSAMQSMVPVDTGLARGIGRLMPHLAGRFESLHVRVPTINVSAMDMAVQVRDETTAEAVNELLASAAGERLKGLIGINREPVASMDFNHDPRSGIVDATQTRVANGRMIKLLAWFDNEWGFASRMLDIAEALARLDTPDRG
ncbi:aldehyde dehydrogenase [Arhodomonas aquaeolei]|uniref:type I glyceraldehyde-3-phosphate dehydrogenase n=1 Tax=Arhodomonas aquaeolei TaxID=2369 RepID=UPI000360D753|nr:glyceraldehyde 3-phosphate dehydrogenase NAD-binding domain-containing protein [Arhodomonas aquaeolei]MCS4505063.1 aldehyde dehydrogenase [Arhodomonas aquaeolei]